MGLSKCQLLFHQGCSSKTEGYTMTKTIDGDWLLDPTKWLYCFINHLAINNVMSPANLTLHPTMTISPTYKCDNNTVYAATPMQTHPKSSS
jgi:hypothetical protein